jgi:hypothetical protein
MDLPPCTLVAATVATYHLQIHTPSPTHRLAFGTWLRSAYRHRNEGPLSNLDRLTPPTDSAPHAPSPTPSCPPFCTTSENPRIPALHASAFYSRPVWPPRESPPAMATPSPKPPHDGRAPPPPESGPHPHEAKLDTLHPRVVRLYTSTRTGAATVVTVSYLLLFSFSSFFFFFSFFFRFFGTNENCQLSSAGFGAQCTAAHCTCDSSNGDVFVYDTVLAYL